MIERLHHNGAVVQLNGTTVDKRLAGDIVTIVIALDTFDGIVVNKAGDGDLQLSG